MPLLARALLHHNQRLQAATGTHNRHSGSVASRPLSPGPDEEYYNYNLAGYIVGNAVTDEVYDGVGQVEFAFDLGLIDPDTYHTVKQTCKVIRAELSVSHSRHSRVRVCMRLNLVHTCFGRTVVLASRHTSVVLVVGRGLARKLACQSVGGVVVRLTVTSTRADWLAWGRAVLAACSGPTDQVRQTPSMPTPDNLTGACSACFWQWQSSLSCFFRHVSEPSLRLLL